MPKPRDSNVDSFAVIPGNAGLDQNLGEKRTIASGDATLAMALGSAVRNIYRLF
jgi:hypothetical protein